MTTLASTDRPADDRRGRLDARRTALAALYGAVLWFAGALIIRWVQPTGALGNALTPLVYGLIVATTVPLVRWAPRLLGVARSQTLACAAIMAATASLLDGVAVRWTPLYGADPRIVADSAACLLWAIGVAVALGLAMSPGAEAA
jgi:hypothetical protein